MFQNRTRYEERSGRPAISNAPLLVSSNSCLKHMNYPMVGSRRWFRTRSKRQMQPLLMLDVRQPLALRPVIMAAGSFAISIATGNLLIFFAPDGMSRT